MRVIWKDERLGDYDHDKGLTFDEMHQVKKQLGKQYQHPTIFIEAALGMIEGVDVVRDKAGEPILNEDGSTTIRIIPDENFDPDALRLFVVLMGRRVGKDWYFEDLADGGLADLQVVRETGEIEAAAEAVEEAGKEAAAALTRSSPRSRKKTSSPSSPDASPDSGSTSD